MMVKQEKEPILVRIDEAARELLTEQPSVTRVCTRSIRTEPSLRLSRSDRTLTSRQESGRPARSCRCTTTRSTTLAPRRGISTVSSLR